GDHHHFYPFAYGYFGYPYFDGYGYGYAYYDSYPSNYYAYGDDNYYGDTSQYYNQLPPQQYVASRPIGDVARMEVRLPDPQAIIWVDGKEMTSTGILRQFQSPQLDPSQQYTYT